MAETKTESPFKRGLGKRKGLATASVEELEAELTARGKDNNPFPLDVFHEKIHPFLNALHKYYDFHKGYIGLTLLSCYSTAIGTSYTVSTSGDDKIYLPLWGCLLGLSSSGKSLCFNKIFEPLLQLQNEIDKDWEDTTHGLSEDKTRFTQMPQILYRDSHMPTLIRYVLPDNPKGICKVSDELLEWINGMNATGGGRKEGTDEQVWLSTWNCTNYSAIRSNKVKITLRRPFVNVFGGTQYENLPKFFGNNRDHSGFIFRLLFAIDDRKSVIAVDPYFIMPTEWSRLHYGCIKMMHEHLTVPDADDEPGVCVLGEDARNVFYNWSEAIRRRVNSSEEKDRNIQAGIFGKIKEYMLRFCALLHITDKVMDNMGLAGEYHHRLSMREPITVDVVHRAIKLADYFYIAAEQAYENVILQKFAPREAMEIAALFNKLYLIQRKTLTHIAGVMYGKETEGNRKKFERNLKRYMVEYHWLFNAKER